VIFDGLDEGQLKAIVFAEVKAGSSTMNTRERQVRDAVQAGRVGWIEIRPQLNFADDVIESGGIEKTSFEANGLNPDVKPAEKRGATERVQALLNK
jgi:hypothetical protein